MIRILRSRRLQKSTDRQLIPTPCSEMWLITFCNYSIFSFHLCKIFTKRTECHLDKDVLRDDKFSNPFPKWAFTNQSRGPVRRNKLYDSNSSFYSTYGPRERFMKGAFKMRSLGRFKILYNRDNHSRILIRRPASWTSDRSHERSGSRFSLSMLRLQRSPVAHWP